MFDGTLILPARPERGADPEMSRISTPTAVLLTTAMIAAVPLIVLALNWAGLPISCTDIDELVCGSSGWLA